jgi:hypothetical protein
MSTTTAPTARSIELDGALAERLECVCVALGARGLPLAVIVRALLAEATSALEAERDARRDVLDP